MPILLLPLFLFYLPNAVGAVSSPIEDIAILTAVSIGGWAAYSNISRQPGDEAPPNQSIIFVVVLSLTFLAMWLFPQSAIYHSMLEGYSPEIRENSLKLASTFVQGVVNLSRDAILPYVIIAFASEKGLISRAILLVAIVLFCYFALFNLAKSFILINSFAIGYAIFGSRTLLFALPAGLAGSIGMGWLTGGIRGIGDIVPFLRDFIIRRIATLTPELGVDVRNYVASRGFYWASSHETSFEMELYRFIRHTDLPTGWANVYFVADAFARGGYAAIGIAAAICATYISWFILVSRVLGRRFASFAIVLFFIYIYMQGVFSRGVFVSFVIGPIALMVIQFVAHRYGRSAVDA